MSALLRGRPATLATRHGKLAVVAPPLERATGMRIAEAAADTDAFGTFAGDRPRTLPPLDTAVAKARAGMALAGTDLGLASEGTIGPDPVLGFTVSDVELVVLVDDLHHTIVHGVARSSAIVAARATIRPDDDLSDFLARAHFPSHALIVRPAGVPTASLGSLLVKGISDEPSLLGAIAAASAASPEGAAHVESDLRAHCSPSRRAVIAEAAEELASRLRCDCPSCGHYGWGPIRPLIGRRCAWCDALAPARRGDVLGCPACPHEEEAVDDDGPVDPARCPSCNP